MHTAEQFWDRIAPKYAAQPVANMEAYEKTLARTGSYLGPDDDVLELGCGTGTTALKLAPSVSQMTGSDVSMGMIKIAGQKALQNGAPNVNFRQAVAKEHAASGETYDTVLAFNLLHLVDDLDATLADVRRLLKPGGLFISKTACLAGKWWLRPVIWGMRLARRAPYVAFLSDRDLEDAIASQGFCILESGNHAPGSHFIVARLET